MGVRWSASYFCDQIPERKQCDGGKFYLDSWFGVFNPWLLASIVSGPELRQKNIIEKGMGGTKPLISWNLGSRGKGGGMDQRQNMPLKGVFSVASFPQLDSPAVSSTFQQPSKL